MDTEVLTKSKELDSVENELTVVQSELDTLLQRQEDLLERKSLLKSQLESLESSRIQMKNTELRSQDWEEGNFPWNAQVTATLKSIFKIETFRPLQMSCINATLSNKDTILIMPTGGGKSLCYQLPAVLSKGLTLIVSPLVSLMEDQLLAVKNLGIESYALNASTSRENINFVHKQMAARGSTLKLLYATPERLSKSKRFMSNLEKAYENGHLSRIVIDEVHCTSQWGHDFRPDYKILGILKRQFPSVPILGLTATATAKVLQDVKEMLSLKECLVFRASYNRANLFYEVQMKSSKCKIQMDSIADLIKRKFSAASGIVYCFSRKDTEDVSSGLCERGLKAAHYHADLSAAQRSGVHMKWLNNSIQVIVATVAFGMGIDKPDVRFVIHHSISKSMENYYQESGRAGRDGKPAHCVLYFRAADAYRQSTMVFTEHTGLQNLYAMLKYCLNKAECRRAVIARSFGEKWDPADCNSSCDVCSLHPLSEKAEQPPTNSTGFIPRRSAVIYTCVEEDISEHCKTLVNVLEVNQGKNKRLTALKLADLWRERQKKTPQKLDYENILLEAILFGVLKEEFHFTPYSTISYIGVGRKAEAVKRGVVKVKVRNRVPHGSGLSGAKSGECAISAPSKAVETGVQQASSPTSTALNKTTAPTRFFSKRELSTPKLKAAERKDSPDTTSKSMRKTATNLPSTTLNTPTNLKVFAKRKVTPKLLTQALEKKDSPETTEDDLQSREPVKRILPKMLLSSSNSGLFSDELDFLPLKRAKLNEGASRLYQRTSNSSSSKADYKEEGIVIEIDSD